MSYSVPPKRKRTPKDWAQLGAYESPFSGTGFEFHPLGIRPPDSHFVLHETGYDPHRPHWNYQRVFSPFWRLYYDFEAGHSVVLENRKTALGPDRMILIPDHQLFHTNGTEPRAKFWFAFSCRRRVTAQQSLPVRLRPSKTEKALLEELVKLLWPIEERMNEERIYHLSLALLHIVLSRPEISWQAEAPEELQRIIRHMEERYATPLYISDLARLVHMSETTFRKQFKNYRHVSPTDFIAQIRVREAGHLLSTTNLDLEQIAERTGFPNAAYLSRVFRRLTGRTPGHARSTVTS